MTLTENLATLRTLIDQITTELAAREQAPKAATRMVEIHVPEHKPKLVRGRKVNYQDKRLPPVGSLIVRKYEGKTYLVKILADGFEHAGHKWRSLSAVARHITGTQVNGYKWFGLE